MKRLFLIVAFVAIVAWFGGHEYGLTPEPPAISSTSASKADAALKAAYESGRSDLQIHGEGEVVKVLSDDNDGSRHQRFILRTITGQTILVAHNIDLADRVANLKAGDHIEFNGEYEWNDKGGVIHWTHRDPKGWHEGGWIKHKGHVYE